MFSWTIDGKEYTCPRGYGQITIERFATYMATVPASMRANIKTKPKKEGFMARLVKKINRATEDLKAKAIDENDDWLQEYQSKAEFVAYWLKCHDIIDLIDPATVLQIWQFINMQWAAWQPEKITRFEHADKLWIVDYSFDTLATVGDFTDLQVVMAHVCSSNGKQAKPREWGSLSLHVAASIMHEIKRNYSVYGTIAGASILDHFNINVNGK